MPKVKMSTTLYVPANAVWNMVGGFNQLARWHPAVANSEEKQEKEVSNLIELSHAVAGPPCFPFQFAMIAHKIAYAL